MEQRKYTVEIEHEDAEEFLDYWNNPGWRDTNKFMSNIAAQLERQMKPSFVQRLSENFALAEFMQSETAQQRGINNWVGFTRREYDNLKQLCECLLQPLRKFVQVPIIITSGYSNEELSIALGRDPNTTQHRKGQAADIYSPRMSTAELFTKIACNFPFDQLIIERPSASNPRAGWVHVSYVSREENREEILLYNGRNYIPFADGDFGLMPLKDLLAKFISEHALP